MNINWFSFARMVVLNYRMNQCFFKSILLHLVGITVVIGISINPIISGGNVTMCIVLILIITEHDFPEFFLMKFP